MHELERPDPGSSEVLIRVVASALSPGTQTACERRWAKLDPRLSGMTWRAIWKSRSHQI